MTTLIDCGVSFKGTDDFVTWAEAGMSNAVPDTPLAVIFTTGNSAGPAVFCVLPVLAGVLADVPVPAFGAFGVVRLAASGAAACAKTSVGAAEKAIRSAAWIWRKRIEEPLSECESLLIESRILLRVIPYNQCVLYRREYLARLRFIGNEVSLPYPVLASDTDRDGHDAIETKGGHGRDTRWYVSGCATDTNDAL
ncbi:MULTISPECIES: hypothetical protein [Paraburkholderia]|uniref:hypothetical protein n=1 Tax=Paraburkholderia TaxID=1822464 RepID=UPI0038BDC9B5